MKNSQNKMKERTTQMKKIYHVYARDSYDPAFAHIPLHRYFIAENEAELRATLIRESDGMLIIDNIEEVSTEFVVNQLNHYIIADEITHG